MLAIRDQKPERDHYAGVVTFALFLFERIRTFYRIFYFAFLLACIHLTSNNFPSNVG